MSLSSKKIVEFSILTILGFTLYFGVTTYHNWKYKQALKSGNQIRECGEFIEKTEIVKERFGPSDSIEPIYTLQPQQSICFQYATISKDKNDFFPLTNLY